MVDCECGGMKRVNGGVDGGDENMGSKKPKFSNGVDENSADLDGNGVHEERVFVENGGMGSAEVDKIGDLFGDMVPDNLEAPNLGDLVNSNIWDFDIGFGLTFGNEEEREGLGFDLNLPVYRTHEGVIAGDSLEISKGPMSTENKVDIIDIPSDDSENEVEITGYTCGYTAKGKQVDLGLPYDRMDNAVGKSGVVTGDEVIFTGEAKEMAGAVDSLLSLANSSFDLNLGTDSDEFIWLNEPKENIEVVTWQPAAPAPAARAARSESAERALRQAEQESRYREWVIRDRKETAKKFARSYFSDQKNGIQSSSQKQPPPSSGPVEQLGDSFGPFFEALKMVRERTSKQVPQQLIGWRPSEENQNRSITAAFVPSLLDLSLKALAQNAEGIVSLEHVPDNLRARLTNILCDTGAMNAHIMNLLVEGCPTEIRIKNCSWVTEKQFQQTFGNCQTKDLRVLQLDLCGQCMLDFAFRGTFAQSSNSFSRLAIVSLRGACRLTDNGLKDLIMSAPALLSINLGQCTLLTSDAVNFIADSLGSNLRELYIDDCHKIDAMLILPAFKKFRCLEVLSVAGIRTITDQFVCEMVSVCGQSLKELDLANCYQLTDFSLKATGSSCADLCSLNISSLQNLTDLGMEYLANGCKSIHKLKLCRNEFSDEAVAAFLESSGEHLVELILNNMTKVGANTALSLAKRSRKLLSLDVSWCRGLSNEALGLIVDCCSSLKLLKIFGCRQITNVFLNGHSNPLVRIIGLNLTPILDHMNLLEPEEMLLRYSPLPIYMGD